MSCLWRAFACVCAGPEIKACGGEAAGTVVGLGCVSVVLAATCMGLLGDARHRMQILSSTVTIRCSSNPLFPAVSLATPCKAPATHRNPHVARTSPSLTRTRLSEHTPAHDTPAGRHIKRKSAMKLEEAERRREPPIFRCGRLHVGGVKEIHLLRRHDRWISRVT